MIDGIFQIFSSEVFFENWVKSFWKNSYFLVYWEKRLQNGSEIWLSGFMANWSSDSLLWNHCRPPARPSVRPSVTKFFQDWIISFFWYCTWWLTMISSDWWSQVFEKKKLLVRIWARWGLKLGFLPFSQVWLISFPWNWIQR